MYSVKKTNHLSGKLSIDGGRGAEKTPGIGLKKDRFNPAKEKF